MVVTASADGDWLIKSCSQPSARPSAFDALIDGVKVPDFPGSHIAAPTGYTRDFIDLDAIKALRSSAVRLI